MRAGCSWYWVVEEILNGEVGQAPQLHVRAGAVARRDQSAVLDGVAPQFSMPQSRAIHGCFDPRDRGVEAVTALARQAREQRVHVPAPHDERRMISISAKRLPHVA